MACPDSCPDSNTLLDFYVLLDPWGQASTIIKGIVGIVSPLLIEIVLIEDSHKPKVQAQLTLHLLTYRESDMSFTR